MFGKKGKEQSMATKAPPQRRGFHTITPSLTVRGAKAAVDFYIAVFKATVLERHEEADGTISNAIIKIGDSPLMLSDENSQHEREHAHEGWARSPAPPRGASASMYVYVPDVDEVFQRATSAGATVIAPVADKEWGDRLGGFRDPFGHIWNVATHVAEMAH
jgi:PhnB protein